jgi:hypothetical protein
MFSLLGLRSGVCLLSTVICTCLAAGPASANTTSQTFPGVKATLVCVPYSDGSGDGSSFTLVNYKLETTNGGLLTNVNATLRVPLSPAGTYTFNDIQPFSEPWPDFTSDPLLFPSPTVNSKGAASLEGIVSVIGPDGNPTQLTIPRFSTANCS